MEITPLPCPFCGWEKIRVLQSIRKGGIFKGSAYTYAWCKVCGARGPWAYTISCSDDITCREAIARWNERGGVKQDGTV